MNETLDRNTELLLVNAALEARNKSYSPYSHYAVGAALLTASGKIYTGANIENASFTPTVCAERVAVFTAIHAGERAFSAIAVAGGEAGKPVSGEFPPCGVCRQVLAEFCSPDLPVLLALKDGYRKTSLGELLPSGFGPGFLKTDTEV